MFLVEDFKNVVFLGEGMILFIKMFKLGKEMDILNLYMKDEGIILMGLFKVRGVVVGVLKVKELGVE